MGFPHFIARRILVDKERQDRLSRPIVVIAVLGIVIGMAVMILTVGISTGFQREVRAKVTGAGSHIEIVPILRADQDVSTRIPIRQSFYPSLDTVPGVRHIQVSAVMPGIIETKDEIQGVAVKGVGKDHDWSFLQQHLVAGRVLRIGDTVTNAALISEWMARRLEQQVGDTVTIYLVKGQEEIRPRRYRIAGIYQTGLEKIDHEMVFIDIAHIQRFAQWGLQAEIAVLDTVDGEVSFEGLSFGGSRTFDHEWSNPAFRGKGPHRLPLERDTTVMLVVNDVMRTLPDTAWLTIADGQVSTRTSGGSYKDYCGGFEVSLDDTRDLERLDELIYHRYLGENLRTITAKERFPEIFAWLELLDTNVIVVILLMLVVAIINMTSALLIIIIERTPMIGVLKALGTSNGMIRRIFLIDAAYILGAGILIGDLVGIGLALVQRHLGLVRLPIESYYVDQVPVDLELLPIAGLNIGVLLVCVAALIVPSMMVARIMPAKAIKFD
ncbi:MAG TPA: ABC transporter permease [Flavobacteriales bacterium]